MPKPVDFHLPSTVPELSPPSSLASSPGVPPETPIVLSSMSASVEHSLDAEAADDERDAGKADAGERRHSVEMGRAMTTGGAGMERRRAGERKGSFPKVEGRRTSLAPRPSLSTNQPTFDPLAQFSTFAFPGSLPPASQTYPGEPSTANLVTPSPFRFGSLDFSIDDTLSAPLMGTPSAELGPFEYPSSGMASTGEAPASPSRRSSTTGQIPLLPAVRRPSVVHSATATGVAQTSSVGTLPLPLPHPIPTSSIPSSLNPRRRPSLLLHTLQAPVEGPTPPSLLSSARRGSLPVSVSSLFPLPNNPNPAPHLTMSSNTPLQLQRTGSIGGKATDNTVSAAYLYNRRSSLAGGSGAGVSSPLLSVRSESVSSHFTSNTQEGPPSPTISSSGSFSSHATVTGSMLGAHLPRSRSNSRDNSGQATPSPSVPPRRASLPFLPAEPQGPSLLETYRKQRLASQEHDMGERERERRLSSGSATSGGVGELRRLSALSLERRMTGTGEIESPGSPYSKGNELPRPASPIGNRTHGLPKTGSPLLTNRTGRLDSFGTTRSSLSSSSSGSRLSIGSVPPDSALSSSSASSSESEREQKAARQTRLQERRRSSRTSMIGGARGSLATIPDDPNASDFLMQQGSGSDSDPTPASASSSSEGDDDEAPSSLVFGGFSFPPKDPTVSSAAPAHPFHALSRPALETIHSDGGTPQGSEESTKTLKAGQGMVVSDAP